MSNSWAIRIPRKPYSQDLWIPKSNVLSFRIISDSGVGNFCIEIQTTRGTYLSKGFDTEQECDEVIKEILL